MTAQAEDASFDVVVVGGGPAGLSAALCLGRCRRRTLVFDDGTPRNAPAPASHGFFTRDGATPEELRRLGREQLRPYGVVIRDERVVDAHAIEGGFLVHSESGASVRCRKLVLATGIRDVLPDVPGFSDFYGTSIWHCPHCDGWEARDRPLAVLARGKEGVELALGLRTWSQDVVLLTHGFHLDARRREQARRQQLPWFSQRVTRFEGQGGQLERVVFEDGTTLAREGVFFHLGCAQRSHLPERLGCSFDFRGAVKTMNHGEESKVPGVYVVGDASVDARLIVVAAAEGAKAALHINKTLRKEDCDAYEREVERQTIAEATASAGGAAQPVAGE